MGERIREVRQRSGCSQQAVVDQLATYGVDWHPTTVGKVEAGVRPLRLAEAAALAEVLDVPLDVLVHGEDSKVREADRLRTALASLGKVQEALEAQKMRLLQQVSDSLDEDDDDQQAGSS